LEKEPKYPTPQNIPLEESFMSYLALYRKLRPTRFADIVDQEHVVTTLQNQISSGRVAHAYLFVGTRGTGKTSLAKIFARAINCSNLQDGESCGVCEVCVSSQSIASANILEIDAASNNSVDNIRELREEIRHSPISGKYKVLIIDEVHMLSTGAFNALLKTLEEPPPHVFFILATTEAYKIPATILSRCQRFDFKRISPKSMAAALRKYMDSENISITDEALGYVTTLSDGAMRDALSLLDRAAALYQSDTITLEKLRELTGAADESISFRLTDAFQNYNSTECLDIIEEIVANGRDITQFTNEYVRHLRDLMLVANLGSRASQLEYSQDRLDKLTQAAKASEHNLRLLSSFVELSAQLRHSNNERINLEVTCIKLCNPVTSATNDTSEINARLEKLEKGQSAPVSQKAVKSTYPQEIVGGGVLDAPQVASQNVNKPKPPQELIATATIPDAPAAPDDIKMAIKNFGALAERLKMPVKAMLKSSTAKYLGGNSLTILADEANHGTLERNKDKIKAELAAMFKKDIDVVIVSAQKFASGQQSSKAPAKDSKETYTEAFGDIVEFTE